jgi:hypothetical protein
VTRSLAGRFHQDAVGTHRLDMRRPLLDAGDIEAGLRQICGDRRSVGSSSDNRNPFIRHSIPTISFLLVVFV